MQTTFTLSGWYSACQAPLGQLLQQAHALVLHWRLSNSSIPSPARNQFSELSSLFETTKAHSNTLGLLMECQASPLTQHLGRLRESILQSLLQVQTWASTGGLGRMMLNMQRCNPAAPPWCHRKQTIRCWRPQNLANRDSDQDSIWGRPHHKSNMTFKRVAKHGYLKTHVLEGNSM